ncbi:MAG: endo-1,4-beta-xylanase [Fibrobacterota bacterium]|nr:MAG: endo-1,4-beta-xylanase [Fibrobacterota bacterium]
MHSRFFVSAALGLAACASFAATVPLTQNGVLVGATAEVGSADKEGTVSWKRSDSVKSVLTKEFGLVQTTSYPSWDTWKGTGLSGVTFDMANPNKVIDFAKSQGKKVAVHLLAGSPTYFPTWLNEGKWTPAELETLLDKWITFAITTNGNASKVDYWNVVNEAFMWDGSYWDSSTVANTNPWQKMGWEADKSGLPGGSTIYGKHPVYIRKAFEMARKHTKAKLELRDYGIEFWDGSRKSKAFYQLVKHLLNTGVPLDAVGFQGHFRTDNTYDWAKLKAAVVEYKKLGLEVYLTELDYGDADPIAAATSAHRNANFDSTQSRQYRQMAAAAVGGGMNWMCFWGVADNTNSYWRMGQSALLFDEQYRPKPAYEAFRQGILDGVASLSSNRPQAQSVRRGLSLVDGILHTGDVSVGEVEIRSLAGTPEARLELRDGAGRIPALARGVHAVRQAHTNVPLGLVTIW